ncbi:MAG: alpha-galactosidase [Clostridia bacterium]|nr:alpha-galactosidase [Clostridia bacterium]
MEPWLCNHMQPSVTADGDVQIEIERDGDFYRLRLHNRSGKDVTVKEVVYCGGDWQDAQRLHFYGEGYTMLSQYEGTPDTPQAISYSDAVHYRLPQEQGLFTVYNLLLLHDGKRYLLLAFSSCHRFSGEFRLNAKQVKAVLNCENLTMAPGESWLLEEFMMLQGKDKNALLEQLAERLAHNHGVKMPPEQPTGWCSWYCFGPKVTKDNILENTEAVQRELPELSYIQIDDGYQAFMGDWLEVNEQFKPNVQTLCQMIREKGGQPAIWVAPFIAEQDSRLLREHPEWFVQREDGSGPLRSDEVTFGGWRHGPWYMLDGTHPGARDYLTKVFRTIRQEWGCSYFKLDANTWGAFPFGRRFDSSKTSVEAYRMGMQAIREGAGEDGFLLGCNAPMWPSIGTVDGMRVTDDIKRSWDRVRSLAKQQFYRNWQHGRLWVSDPDCAVLENMDIQVVGPDGKINRQGSTILSPEEFSFHAAVLLASGGMILSGDDVTELREETKKRLKKLVQHTGEAAAFGDETFTYARTGDRLLFLFNAEDAPQTVRVQLEKPFHLHDFWTEEPLGKSEMVQEELPPHSARVIALS